VVTVEPIAVGDHVLVGVEVKLPKTTLLTISTNRGYIMCGATIVCYFARYQTGSILPFNPLWDKLSFYFLSFSKVLKNLKKSSKNL
jgi:hypothetical protein